jgi:hypothetical protein
MSVSLFDGASFLQKLVYFKKLNFMFWELFKYMPKGDVKCTVHEITIHLEMGRPFPLASLYLTVV